VRRQLLTTAIAILACLPCAADGFRLVEAADEAAYERRINASAEVGFELVSCSIGLSADGRERLLALMLRSAESHGTQGNVRVLTTSGALDHATLEPINLLAQQSFTVDEVLVRPLPDWWISGQSYEAQLIWILSRDPHGEARNYELRSVSAAREFETRLAEQPRAVVELLASGRRIHALLGDEYIDRDTDGGSYRLLIESRRHHLRRKLNRASREGYKILHAAPSTVNAPPILLLEQTSSVQPRTHKILAKPLELHRRGRLADTLTSLGEEGFEMIPQTLLGADWIAVQSADRSKPKSRRRFRLIRSRDGDPAQLATSALADGYAFVALLTAPAETLILMQQVDEPTN